MGNHIVIEPACKIREIARNALAGFWKPVLLGFFIYYLLSSGISMVLDEFFSFSQPVELYGQTVVQKVSYGGSIYDLIIGGPLELGITLFLLTFFRTKKTDNTLLFEGFSHFGRALWLLILMSVKILLWSLLLVVPGIIASFRYSQAFFVLADHPEMSASQCIKESCRLMAGNKGRYFYLQLTFIGWYILASIPGGLYFGLSDGYGITSVIIALILTLPTLVVDTYVMVSCTAFYELAAENLVVVSDRDYNNMVNTEYTVHEGTESAGEAAPAADEQPAAEASPAAEEKPAEEAPEAPAAEEAPLDEEKPAADEEQQ